MKFADQRSIYLQIADLICDTILSGDLPDGDRVSSVREMASNIEVNPNTVQRSYSLLQDQGVLDNKRGIGYFIAQDAYQKVKSMKRDQFIKDELPQIFRTMELLGIDLDDLHTLHSRHKQQI